MTKILEANKEITGETQIYDGGTVCGARGAGGADELERAGHP